MPVFAPEMDFIGAVSSAAVRLYTVIELFELLATKISLLTVSTAMPCGLFKLVLAPEMVRIGVTLPAAVLPYTVIESLGT